MVFSFPTPLIRGAPADIFPRVMHLQSHPYCGNRELKVLDCMEAYGYYRGQEECRTLIEDMYECVSGGKRDRRILLMMEERERQEKSGQRKKEDRPKQPVDLF